MIKVFRGILAISLMFILWPNPAYAAPNTPSITKPASLEVNEGTVGGLVFTETEATVAAVSWTILARGGDDSNDFTYLEIKSSTAKSVTIGFKVAPDYETPLDGTAGKASRDNVYKIVLKATNSAVTPAKTQEVNVDIEVKNVDDTAPIITGTNSLTVVENSSATTVLQDYNANETVTWALEGVDASLFTISATGELKLVSSPDYEAKSSYEITVAATDSASNKATLAVTVNVTDVDEVAPVISGSDAINVNENINVTTVLQDYNANETVTWALEGVDASLFTISATGELKLVSSPNYEVKSSYAITVAATDSASNKATLAVTVNVTDVDEVAPVILCDSSDCGGFLSIDVPENATGGVVYSFDSDEPVTWTIENCTAETCASGDKNLFSINASGDLSINAIEFDPTPGLGEGNDNSYTVVIVATDSLSNSTTLEFNVNVTDVDTVAPTITGNSSISVSEDVDITTVLATYSANEAVTWALEGADAASFSINASGELLFAVAPDYETKSSYSVTITATDVASNSSSSEVLITILDVTEAGGGGNDGDQTPSEDAKKIIEAKLIREVTDAHSNLKNSLVNSMAQSGIKAMVNPQDLIYLAVPGLNSENVGLIHKSFSASKLTDSVDAFMAYAKKYSIVSRLATVGLTKGVTLKELQVLGLVDSNSSADASLLRALRSVPVSDRDTVEELEKVIASLLASR